MKNINIVWLKRDFRLTDHEPLHSAITNGNPIILLYCFEPSIYSDPHYSNFHFEFIKQSIAEMNGILSHYQSNVIALESEVLPVLNYCREKFDSIQLWSHQETGLDITYQRDKQTRKWCNANRITWTEFQNNGVIRGLSNRKTWSKEWGNYMRRKIKPINLESANFLSIDKTDPFYKRFLNFDLKTTESSVVQTGGSGKARHWLNSFLEERYEHYMKFISKPLSSRTYCSRLSPYIAWGNISVREIYQRTVARKKEIENPRMLSGFMSRLRWQGHFIQKFEMEPRMEFEAHNRGFLNIVYERNENFINAWKNGRTGYPLVDASIHCLKETGYLNFRMRTMISSFFTHHLFQHFTEIGPWLARNFLDFEPGIHYPQLQMQSGLTGYNTVRIYNPIKNAKEHDSEARFIKKFVPELDKLPPKLAIEPWTITSMEEEMFSFKLERDYPHRIVDIAETRKPALNKLYGQRKNPLAQKEKQRILNRHTIPRKR